MKKRIFITACCFRAPGLKEFGDIIQAMDNPDFKAPFKELILSDHHKSLVAKLELDTMSLHYPSRSSLKVLRSDVIAAIVCSGELMDQAGLIPSDMLDVPLYISNGSSFDLETEQISEITEAYLPHSSNDTLFLRNQRVTAALPPLYVLRALANATECFVAQKTGAKGGNATFGGSSHSTHYALLEGIRKIENGVAEKVIVGASSGIGVYSSLKFRNSPENDFTWRESEGTGFFLFESEESVSESGRIPMAEIVSLSSSKNVPEIFSDPVNKTAYQDFDQDLADFCIYSGGLSESDHDREELACENKWAQSFSWFNRLGIMGTNAIMMNMATSIAMFNQDNPKQVDCLNRDPYGRESFIKIQSFGS